MPLKNVATARARRPTSSHALTAEIEIRYTDDASGVLAKMASALFAAPYKPVGTVAATVLIHPDRQRLTLKEGDKKTLTLVHHGERRMTIWDHARRKAAKLADPLPPSRFKPLRSFKIERHTSPELVTAVLSLTDPMLGRVRHEIDLSRRSDLKAFGPALLYLLHCGPLCHATSGVPIERLANYGVVVAERCFLGRSAEPVMTLRLDQIELVKVSRDDFAPPADFHTVDLPVPFSRPEKKPASNRARRVSAPPSVSGGPPPSPQGAPAVPPPPLLDATLTPICISGTHRAAITATVHQDFFDDITNLINTVSPLLGTATLGPSTPPGTGVITMPFLAAIQSMPASGLGSGLAVFLRQPRGAPARGNQGGAGLIDVLAVWLLKLKGPDSKTRLQRAADAGTLGATLSRWGISTAVRPGSTILAKLTAADGDLDALDPKTEFPVVVEGFETRELGVLTIGGIQTAVSNTWNFQGFDLLSFTLSGITGTASFATIPPGGLINTLSIDTNATVLLGLALPDISVTAKLDASPTGWGGILLGVGTVAGCFLLPFACPLQVALSVFIAAVIAQTTTLTLTTTALSANFRIQFNTNPNTGFAEASVTGAPAGGRTTVTSPPSWNVAADIFDSFIEAVTNAFNSWNGPLIDLIASGIQQALGSANLRFPLVQLGSNVDAFAQTSFRPSPPHTRVHGPPLLAFGAEFDPPLDATVMPPVTEAEWKTGMVERLTAAHRTMADDLNPQPGSVPVTTPPLVGRVLKVGSYFAVGVNQNALNYSLYWRWRQGEFNIDITDQPTIMGILESISNPTAVFGALTIEHVHFWPAAPPRVEIAPAGIVGGNERPLVYYFDDLRACFEPFQVPVSHGRGSFRVFELSLNLKFSGTLALDWPNLFKLCFDTSSTVASCDNRTREFVDTKTLGVMAQFPSPSAPDPINFWQPLVDALVPPYMAGITNTHFSAPSAAAVSANRWNRDLMAMQQGILPAGTGSDDTLYMEILDRNRALYLLPAINGNTPPNFINFLQFFDASGSPDLSSMVGAPSGGPPVTLANMDPTQAKQVTDAVILNPALPFLPYVIPPP